MTHPAPDRPEHANLLMVPPLRMPRFDSYARGRYIRLHEGNWRRTSYNTAMAMFEGYIFPKWGAYPLNAIDAVDASAWLAGLARKYSYSLVRKCGTYLRAVLRQAVDEDLLMKDPLRRLVWPQQARRPRPTVTVENLKAIKKELPNERDRLIWELAIYCGFRPSELFALRWDDFNGHSLRVDESVVTCRIGEPKTRASWAVVAVPSVTAARLQVWRAERSGVERDFIFQSQVGTPVDTRSWSRKVLHTAAKRAGAPHVTFQMLRRTWATIAHQAGVSPKTAQAQLRHASLNTTMDTYTQSVRIDMVDAVEKMAALVES